MTNGFSSPPASTEPRIQMVSAYWESQPGRTGWAVDRGSGGPRTVRLIGKVPSYPVRLPTTPSDPSPQPLFDEWVRGTEFLNWWLVRAAEAPADIAFVLRDFPQGVWEVPWELLLGQLHFDYSETTVHHRVAVVRGIDEPRPEAPTEFADKLCVLQLTGDPAGLDLKAEVNAVRGAWDSLGHQVKLRVKRPVHVPADMDTLVASLQRERPQVIWFSGHGRVNQGQTELLFTNGQWVTADRLAGAIAEAGPPAPLYAVFWACDSGKGGGPSTAGSAFTPQLFQLLRANQVMSVVVMQAPIGDRTSQYLARGLFSHLGAGYSLTVALTRTRAQLLDELSMHGNDSRGLDWAAPALWTSGWPVAALDWRKGEAARSQILGESCFLGSGVSRVPGELSVESAPTDDETERATAWVKSKRTWILGEVEDLETRLGLFRALQAMQVGSPLAVVLLDADRDRFERSFSAWAESIHRRLRPGELNQDLAKIINFAQHNAREAWQDLCTLRGACLAVANPPPVRFKWFWLPLQDRNEPAVILSDEVPEQAHGRWQLDSLDVTAEPEKVGEILSQARRLAHALAVLDMPIPKEHIRLDDTYPCEITELQKWDGGEELLVDVRRAYAMASAVRKRVQEGMTAEERQDAHWYAAKMLARLPHHVDSALRIQHQLIKSGDFEEAGLHTAFLVRSLTARPRQLVATVERLGAHDTEFPPKEAFLVARAYASLREQEAAERWLRRCKSATEKALAIEEATWVAVEKARGTRDSYNMALCHAKRAIEHAVNSGDQHREWAMRQDMALLLLHNFGEPGRALTIFRNLIQEIESLGKPEHGSEVGRILAVIKRNCSECVRIAANAGLDTGDDDPVHLLFEAEDLVQETSAPVWAEILYEQAKQERDETKQARGVRRCIEVADQIGHATMAVIARNRLYWRHTDDNLTGWEAIESQLQTYHMDAWVARTLIKGRLSAAHRLQETDPERARAQLRQNLDFLERSKVATGGKRDKIRIAQTYAGLSVLATAGGESNPWTGFLENEWADAWLEEMGNPSVSTIWEWEVV